MAETNSTPILVTPTISKPSVASSSSASIRKPTAPPSVGGGVSANGPATQAPSLPPNSADSAQEDLKQSDSVVEKPSADSVNSESPSTTPTSSTPNSVSAEILPPPSSDTPPLEGDSQASSRPHSMSTISSHPSTENEEENESEWTVDSSVGDEDQDDQDVPPEELEDNKNRVWALVKFSYETDDSEELPLQADEIIEILEQNDDGWWKGRNVFGKEGIFPHNLVILTDDPSAAKSSAAAASVSSPLSTSIPSLDHLPFTTSSSSSSPALALKKARHSIFQKKKVKGDDESHSLSSSPSGSYITSPTSGGAPLRKNSKKDRRSQTLSSGTPPGGQLTKSGSKIVSSPSMPSLPILSNKASRSPSQSNLLPSFIRTSDSSVSPPVQPPSPSTHTPPSVGFILPQSSPSIPSSPQPTPIPAAVHSPTPSSAPSTPTPESPNTSPRSSTPTPTAASSDSFIMKVHIPPSGFSQFKVMSSQTIGDLIAMVAKKRMISAKDCSLRVLTAAPAEAPLDPTTPISSLGAREVRLFVTGESASTLRPISSGAVSSNNLLANVSPNPNPIPNPSGSTYAPAASGRTNKEGYLMKADSNKKMKKIWVTMDKNFVYFYKTSLDKNPTERISLYCATPKPSTDPKKRNYFDLVTVTNTFTFAADTEGEAAIWVFTMQEHCQALIMKQIGATSPEPVAAAPAVERKDQRAKELLQQIRDIPENNICAECSAPKPDWAAINLGIFFCIDCSGIHRSMGVHISQVRSVSLDHWDLSQIMTMETMGNKRANEFWEHTIPPGFRKPTPRSSPEDREEWIRAKYQQKQFIESGRSTPTPPANGAVEAPSTPPPTRPGRTNTPPSNSALAAFLPAEATASYVANRPAPTPVVASPAASSHVAPSPVAPSPVVAPTQATASPALSSSANNITPPQSAAPSPTLSHASSSAQGPQKLPGMDFVGFGFLSYQDGTRPVLKRLIKLLKNTFDENRTVHVAAQNAPSGAWRDVEYQVVDQLSVDTSSVRGYIPMSTKVFEKQDDLDKFLSTHLQPQLDSYRQTVMLHADEQKSHSADRWYVIVEVRMELYELFVDQLDDEGLSPHVVKAAPLLAEGDPAFMYQFIKKTGTHFVRSAVYGGRYMMKTFVEKSQVPDKDEAIRLCQQHFKSQYEGEANAKPDSRVSNYTLEITGGDNRKKGTEWIASIWDRPQVLSYDMESISAVFDDLAVSVRVDAAANEFLSKLKNP